MKCDWVRDNIALYVYDELADDARHELEQHVNRCTDCAAELQGTQEFQQTLKQIPLTEPSPNLLAASRMRLQEALESAEQGPWWRRLVFDGGAWLRQVKLAPALVAAIFIVGFAGGIGTSYKVISQGRGLAPSGPAAPVAEASVAGIRSVAQDPVSNQVSIKYDTVSTQEAKGSMNDQRIQQLLLFAARNNYNSGVRMDSVDLLTQKPDNTGVREVLIYALRNDANPGVRLKALEALGPYVKQDVRVRNAVLDALTSDSNSGVRTQAIHLLDTVKADGSVRSVLRTLAEKDKNQYIRSQARTVLAQLPEMD